MDLRVQVSSASARPAHVLCGIAGAGAADDVPCVASAQAAATSSAAAPAAAAVCHGKHLWDRYWRWL